MKAKLCDIKIVYDVTKRKTTITHLLNDTVHIITRIPHARKE